MRRARAIEILGEEFSRAGKRETCNDAQAEADAIKVRVELALKVAQQSVSLFMGCQELCIDHGILCNICTLVAVALLLGKYKE